MHLQPTAKYLNYKKGNFPVAEDITNTTIFLPVHEFITTKQLNKVANIIEGLIKS